MTFAVGDRVRVAQLIKDEPCSDIDVLLNQVGTVVDPDMPDKDYDGNAVVRVQVLLDEPVKEPVTGEASSDFLFDPKELEKLS